MNQNKEIFGTYQLKRVILEVKHLPVSRYDERITNFIAKYEEHFATIEGHSDNNPLVAYKLADIESHKSLMLEWARVAASYEDIKNVDDVIKMANEVFFKYIEELQITKCNRFGIRTFFLIPFYGSYEELLNLLFAKFYRDQSISKLFGPKLRDLGTYVIELEDGKIRKNLTLGPFKKSEMKRISDFETNTDGFDHGILVDLDSFVLKYKESFKTLRYLSIEMRHLFSSFNSFFTPMMFGLSLGPKIEDACYDPVPLPHPSPRENAGLFRPCQDCTERMIPEHFGRGIIRS